MVQDKTIVKMVSLAYFGFSIALAIYYYSFLNMRDERFGALILALFLGFFAMFGGIGYVLKMFSEPDFTIENSWVKLRNAGTKDEYKDLFLRIRNKGKTKAIDCKVKIKVKGRGEDDYQLILPHPVYERRTSINSGDRIIVQLCQVPKKSLNVAIRTILQQPLVLPKGEKYVLEVRMTGDNFPRKKLHNIELDLSSWGNVGIVLDC
ncbi:MAG: hypothetical protein NWE91_07165 [Candidatus Bathyarchaeota archaeon]|nr:hypothetical protein [Candidatus Bathyarchaeota archaeon]